MNIAFEHASFHKGERTVLKDLKFTLYSGSSYAIMGPMASGKSSLLEAIGKKIFPERGSASIPEGVELVPADYSFHRYIGAAFQYYQQRYHAYDSEIGPTLYEVLQQQVKPLGTIDDRSVELKPPAYPENHLNTVCEIFKIQHLLQRKVTALSTGETRRALIAFSVLKSPRWLLLDNPFTGMDAESRHLLKHILKNLSVQGTDIILTCSPGDLPDFIREILWIENGLLKKTMTQEEIQHFEPSDPFSALDNSILDTLTTSAYQPFQTAVAFRDAIVTYKGQYALHPFTWKVMRGERWALMGPNGSGKSTILSLITADNPQAYRNEMILFDRPRGSGESIWDIKKMLGFVSAELQLYFDRNTPVWEVVASGLHDTLGLFKRLPDLQLKVVFQYLRLLGIQGIAERPIHQLSKGESRLTFLARALVKNPPVLIMDEPCQGLDYSQMIHFRNILNQLVLAFDKTLIYVTHYEEEIPPCVTKRLDISEGKIIRISDTR